MLTGAMLSRCGGRMARIVGRARRAPLRSATSQRYGFSTAAQVERDDEEEASAEPSVFQGPAQPAGLRGMVFGHLGHLDLGGDMGVQLQEIKKRWYDELGTDSALVEMGPTKQPTLLTRDIDVIREILGPKSGSFTNGNGFRKVFGALFPTSVIVVEGPDWKRIRGIVQRAMNRLDQSGLPAATAATCEKSVAGWGEVEEVNVVPHFQRISFDAFHKTSYGIDFDMVSGNNLELLQHSIVISKAIANRTLMPIPALWKLPTAENRAVNSALKALRALITPFIEEQQEQWLARKAKGEAPTTSKANRSLLDALVAASMEEQRHVLSKDELLDQIGTINFGAFDTTSNTMALLLDNLARHPEVQEKLHDAVKELDLERVGLEELKGVEYLMNTLHETNRLSPIAGFVPRDAKQDVVLDTEGGQFHVGKDTAILLDTSSMGLMPDHWDGAEDLETFKPERWEEFKPQRGTYLPFGFGGRQCPGKSIAMSNLAAVLAFFIKNYRVEETAVPCKLCSAVGMTLTDDSKLRFIKRSLD